ncbi:alpha/beta hydrolase fold-domain-containing protein [Hypomontagnella monticulosa]|nr:alpha/beta hydrolase fold-domain-containing protein [Hypomontagnella monticulosa]
MAKKEDKDQSSNEQLRLLWILLPQLPLIFKIILLHILKSSESCKYLDLRTDLTVTVLRSVLNPSKPRPIAKTQAMTLKDPGVTGKIWVSAVASKVPPEQGIRDALLAAIDAMRDSSTKGSAPSFKIPDIVPIEAEWTGYRAAATKESEPPEISEEEKYREMMKECKNPATMLYFHGGAYYLCSPATHRSLLRRLTKLTGGRAYSVRYRLAPQNAFPSALLDALVSYFTLLYPPPGSIHDAVAPGNIVFSGDSAGGNLALALLQTVLEIRRQNRKITWFGAEREVPLPAGLTAMSPWVDLVQSMPSVVRNQKWCYLPPPILMSEAHQPPADDIWPTNPPRKHIYIDDAYMLHPLGSLQMNKTWEGAPPLYISCGWETLQDEVRFLVSKLSRDGVTVVFEEFEAMPHVFSELLPHLAQSHRNRESLANFVIAACDDPKSIQTSYKTIKAKTMQEAVIDLDTLSPFSEEKMREMAREAILERPEKAQLAPLPDVPAKL